MAADYIDTSEKLDGGWQKTEIKACFRPIFQNWLIIKYSVWPNI